MFMYTLTNVCADLFQAFLLIFQECARICGIQAWKLQTIQMHISQFKKAAKAGTLTVDDRPSRSSSASWRRSQRSVFGNADVAGENRLVWTLPVRLCVGINTAQLSSHISRPHHEHVLILSRRKKRLGPF